MLSLEPLFDATGAVALWLLGDRILDRKGRSVGFLSDAVAYNYDGKYCGHLSDGILYDGEGAIVVYVRNAKKLPFIMTPRPSIPPSPPAPSAEPERSDCNPPSVLPQCTRTWSRIPPMQLFNSTDQGVSM